MPDWQTVRLEEVADLLVGFPFKSSGYVADGGVRLLRGDNVIQKDVRWDGAARWPEAEVEQYAAYRLESSDIAVAMDRPWIEAGLKVAEIRPHDLPCLLVQRVTRVRARKMVHPKYLCAVLYSKRFTQWVKSIDTGTTVPHITKADIGTFPFLLPPLDEQQRIAGVLGAFDDLIETNRQLARHLAELIGATVGAALADSAHETRLSENAAFVNGRNFTKVADGVGRPVIRTPEVRSGPMEGTARSTADAVDDNVARAGDILFVWSGTLMINRWRFEDGLVNQHVFKVIPQRVPGWYVYALIEAQLPWFLALAKDKATTMGHIQRAHLDEPMIGLPAAEIARLDPVVGPFWDAAMELQIEADEFARQRDELLPLLMSGKVRVSVVEGV